MLKEHRGEMLISNATHIGPLGGCFLNYGGNEDQFSTIRRHHLISIDMMRRIYSTVYAGLRESLDGNNRN